MSYRDTPLSEAPVRLLGSAVLNRQRVSLPERREHQNIGQVWITASPSQNRTSPS